MLSIFVPVYNEEKSIEKNIERLCSTFKALKKPFEIFIIDDSSKDKTYEIAKKLTKIPAVHYMRFENGPSRRENLAQSFNRAHGDTIVFMDLDLATSLEHIKELISYIEEGYDISIGSRYLGIRPKREFSRKIISLFYNNFIKFYLGSKIHDHQCGFKAFKKEIILKLVEEAGYDKKFIRGWFWDAEILIRAQKKGYKIKEFPVKWNFGDKTSFILKRELRMIKYILKLRPRL